LLTCFVSILLLSLSYCSQKKTFLKRTKVVRPVCVLTDAVNFMFPAQTQTGDAVTKKAKKQTKAARMLLAKPNATAMAQLKAMATKLEGVMKKFIYGSSSAEWATTSSTDRQEWVWNKNLLTNIALNRQIQEGGSTGLSNPEFQQPIFTMMSLLARIKGGNGSAADHVALIGLLGDLGSVLCDGAADLNGESGKNGGAAWGKIDADITDKQNKYNQKKLLSDASPADEVLKAATKNAKYDWDVALKQKELQKDEIPTLIAKIMGDDITADELNTYSWQIRRAMGGSYIAPSKKADRSNCQVVDGNAGNRAIDGFPPRYGVLNLGGELDTEGVPAARAISWPWQTVPMAFATGCNNEPFAGHLSGSIGELLYIFDLLTWHLSGYEKLSDPVYFLGNFDGAKKTYTNKFYNRVTKKMDAMTVSVSTDKRNDAARQSKAALASAFLLATGMHSAVEVLYAVDKYLGETVPDLPDANVANKYRVKNWACLQDATQSMVDLMAGSTKTSK